MSDETLLSLEELERQEITAAEKEELEKPYDIRIAYRELVLRCSLILTAPEVIQPLSWTGEQANDAFVRLWTSFYPHLGRLARASGDRIPLDYLGEESLPDICGRCFRTVGFCAGGRIRDRCRICNSGQPHQNSITQSYFYRYLYPTRGIGIRSNLLDAIYAQLIYKYHSPNGDRSWQMMSLMS